MTPIARTLLAIAALALLIATGLGAYASHGLEGVLEPRALASLDTAIDYHFFHALGLLAAAILVDRCPDAWLFRAAAVLFIAGIVLFSGSIYVTALGGPAGFGRAAPLGGVSFMAGWLALAVGALRR